MATRQSTVRLPKRSWEQVAKLAEIFGDNTKTFVVAIDRLYQQEIAVNISSLVARIEIEYSEDGLFGADGPQGYDLRASFAKFEELLEAAIRQDYPDAEINIRNGGDWHKATDAQGLEVEAETEAVGGIIHAVWSDWKWLVK